MSISETMIFQLSGDSPLAYSFSSYGESRRQIPTPEFVIGHSKTHSG